MATLQYKVNNTLVCRTSVVFLAADILLCVLMYVGMCVCHMSSFVFLAADTLLCVLMYVSTYVHMCIQIIMYVCMHQML